MIKCLETINYTTSSLIHPLPSSPPPGGSIHHPHRRVTTYYYQGREETLH